jgi:3-hydroxymyristoyl/3-hydroxydecanoyl-(acyl carrier protein) dehydratase
VTPLPAIHDLRRAGDSVALALDVTPDLPVFDGHFSQTPILAAVVQLDWAIRIARENFPLPARALTVHTLKFLRIVQPPVRLALELRRDNGGPSVSFTFSHRGAACSSGRIEFTDDATGSDRPVP